ncbi:MAG: glutathione S-transferase family protein [Bdellovibrionales bacterium]
MYHLYHHPLDPQSRRVRLTLAEKGVSCHLASEKPWDPSAALLALNPAGELPVLIIERKNEKLCLADAQSICEYLDETLETPGLLGASSEERAETRRLIAWFDLKFHREVTTLLLGEKAIKRLMGAGEPDSLMIRAGYHNIHGHLDYIGWLIERRNWLAGEELTLADLAAGAQLSVLDYLGDVPWNTHPVAKDWYARLKSRPSFRSLLGDRLTGFPPPKHYADLDF